jgi:hypothetical protein
MSYAIFALQVLLEQGDYPRSKTYKDPRASFSTPTPIDVPGPVQPTGSSRINASPTTRGNILKPNVPAVTKDVASGAKKAGRSSGIMNFIKKRPGTTALGLATGYGLYRAMSPSDDNFRRPH